jgi:hypothetical protein
MGGSDGALELDIKGIRPRISRNEHPLHEDKFQHTLQIKDWDLEYLTSSCTSDLTRLTFGSQIR